MIDITESVLGGFICKVCGKFNPKLEPVIQCLEKPAKGQIEIKKKIKRIFEMLYKS